jgi:hypothetical protein
LRGRISGADKRFFPCRQGKDARGVAAIDAAARQDARDPAAELGDGSHDYLARANRQIGEFASASAKAMKRAITTSWSWTQPIDIGTRYYRAPFPAIRDLGPVSSSDSQGRVTSAASAARQAGMFNRRHSYDPCAGTSDRVGFLYRRETDGLSADELVGFRLGNLGRRNDMTKRWIACGGTAAALILALASCTNPYDPAQRAVGGGLLGAGTGAAIGGAVGGGHGAALGAAIGGATGALTGVATTPPPPPPPGAYYGPPGGYGQPAPGYGYPPSGYAQPAPGYGYPPGPPPSY